MDELILIIIIIIILSLGGLYVYFRIETNNYVIKLKKVVVLNLKLIINKIFKSVNLRVPQIFLVDNSNEKKASSSREFTPGDLMIVEVPEASQYIKNALPIIMLPCNSYNYPDSGCCDINVPILYNVTPGSKDGTQKVQIKITSCSNFVGSFIIKYHMEYMYNGNRVYGRVFTQLLPTKTFVLDNIINTTYDKMFYIKITYYNPNLVETKGDNGSVITKLEHSLNFWINLPENIILIPKTIINPLDQSLIGNQPYDVHNY